jgi:hypothetical protein
METDLPDGRALSPGGVMPQRQARQRGLDRKYDARVKSYAHAAIHRPIRDPSFGVEFSGHAAIPGSAMFFRHAPRSAE